MKKLLLIAMLCLPVITHASEPIRLEGVYNYSHVEIAQVREQEIVPSLNSQRYAELVADKFICKLRGDFFVCQKIVKGVGLPASIETQLNSAWQSKSFTFNQSQLDPSLVNESESLLEWDIFDNVKSEGVEANEYHYYLIKSENDVHKISINFPSGQRWLNISDEKMISTPVQKIERLSQFTSRIFELDLTFIR